MVRNNYHLQLQASEFRQKYGIGKCEPIQMRSWLEKLGVLAIFRPMSMTFSGLAVRSGGLNFIIINSNHRVSKQHFTIAHEIYHLFVQPDFKSELTIAGNFDKKNKSEYDADIFATLLLMPEDCILALIPNEELSFDKISLSTIIKIEQYFACSRMAVLIRLKELGLINFDNYKLFTQNVEASALRLGYDSTLYKDGNHGLIIGDYGEKAKKLFEQEKISESHYKSLMLDIGIDLDSISNTDEEE